MGGTATITPPYTSPYTSDGPCACCACADCPDSEKFLTCPETFDLVVCYHQGEAIYCFPYDNHSTYEGAPLGDPFVANDSTRYWIIAHDTISGGEIILQCYSNAGVITYRINFFGGGDTPPVLSTWDAPAGPDCCPPYGDFVWVSGDHTLRTRVQLFAEGASNFPDCCAGGMAMISPTPPPKPTARPCGCGRSLRERTANLLRTTQRIPIEYETG